MIHITGRSDRAHTLPRRKTYHLVVAGALLRGVEATREAVAFFSSGDSGDRGVDAGRVSSACSRSLSKIAIWRSRQTPSSSYLRGPAEVGSLPPGRGPRVVSCDFGEIQAPERFPFGNADGHAASLIASGYFSIGNTFTARSQPSATSRWRWLQTKELLSCGDPFVDPVPRATAIRWEIMPSSLLLRWAADGRAMDISEVCQSSIGSTKGFRLNESRTDREQTGNKLPKNRREIG